MRELMRERGFDCSKIYAQAHPDGYLQPKKTEIRWLYHIAPLVITGTGVDDQLVLDPSLCSKPVRKRDWLFKFTNNTNPELDAIALQVGSPTWFIPGNDLFEMTAQDLPGYDFKDADFYLEGSKIWIDVNEPFERELTTSEYSKERMLSHWANMRAARVL